MPCSATTNIPPGSSPGGIPGFGTPFTPQPPAIPPPISNFPEDLNAIFSALQFITPANILKPALHSNYDKTPFDGIMNLLNQFMPFLSMYGMFMPVLNMIVCIIEVICAIPNPFKLIDKIQQLFLVCLPQFLSLFPQFAMIVMILSIIVLLIFLVEYIITEVLNLVNIILVNINTIARALTLADDRSIASATQKIGQALCAFQNLFVLLSLFDAILSIVKEIIKLVSAIPPCSDSSNPGCCTSDVCPSFIRNNTDIIASTGTLQYYNEAGISFPGLPFTFDERSESWQFYDASATIPLAFINITNAYDLPDGYTAIFFPTDGTYNASTPPSQAPYLVSLRLFYDPSVFSVSDPKGARFIRINNCIITAAPTATLSSYDNSQVPISTGVLKIAGGLAFEDDNATQIMVNGNQASLNTLIHMSGNISIIPPSLNPTDGAVFSNITYDFKIQHPILLGKALITLGCVPSVALDRVFINTTFGNNINVTLLNNLALPDVAGAQLCLSTALAGLQSNVSSQGLATFQATTAACLSNLRNQSVAAATSLINIGFDPYKSTLTINPNIQFTTEPILVTAVLNETNGAPLASNLPADIGATIAQNITPTITFGTISEFVYDGYTSFTANITAATTGSGTIKVAYQGQTISTVNIPTDLTKSPTITEVLLPYEFVFSPVSTSTKTGVGDTEGETPRFGPSDIASE